MGQKIHPHGLRVGINRKWDASWFASNSEWKDIFFHQKQIEDFFKTFFYLYPYTKNSTTKRVLLVDLKLFKYSSRYLFLFVFFYKFRTKRSKENTKGQKKNIILSTKQKHNNFSKNYINYFK